jgi:DNA topoisomerase III
MACLSVSSLCVSYSLLISGPCQFPTLGFVVSRYSQVNAFVPEPFWYIFLSLTRKSDETVFTWRRGHLFEYQVAAIIYEHVLEDATTRVTKVVNKSTKKWCVDSRCYYKHAVIGWWGNRKPLPLTTVELQKAGSRLLKMAPKKVLDVCSSVFTLERTYPLR